ncbi:MAG: TetR/AcrR family transcriptional regulator [Candidatus Dormibacteraeota bacterium]|nr:TetR/AcrR family transcriptional regulator [Candidatus Dormibacteraeota bacterium]
MSVPYESHGRAGQKGRTRSALVSAARALIARGEAPTVEAAAAAALISRTTAYRYFSSQRALLLAAHPEIETQSMLPASPPEDPQSRLEMVLQEFHRVLLETELQQRTVLRLSLEPGARRGDHPLRQGRAIGWIAEALSPLQTSLPRRALMRLIFAIRSATGIEALVWLTDVAGLSRDEAVVLMRDSAQALLRSALPAAGPGKSAGGHRQAGQPNRPSGPGHRA